MDAEQLYSMLMATRRARDRVEPEHLLAVGRVERQRPGEHLERHHGQGVDILPRQQLGGEGLARVVHGERAPQRRVDVRARSAASLGCIGAVHSSGARIALTAVEGTVALAFLLASAALDLAPTHGGGNEASEA